MDRTSVRCLKKPHIEVVSDICGGLISRITAVLINVDKDIDPNSVPTFKNLHNILKSNFNVKINSNS